MSESNIKDGDINQLSADGAANSIDAVSEYEALSRTHRSNNVSFTVCLAHQNKRSGGLASGTIEFADPKNAELGTVINKSHKIQGRMNCATTQMKVYETVQEKRGRKPPLKPKVSVKTKWNSSIDETKRANQIMGDICETNDTLFGPGGAYYDLITSQERNSNDFSRFTYTKQEKMALCQ